ncbi:hypothetical protein BLX24_21030 [Arsenicibacter rosenii]|uniref:Uncharacterized protein n=1 Tax=Arsenicibacter rosenii TaxID=1750698 RepID=A0A1S2VH79_9BACT|nr:hypothetical protein BLX24_21030 [Arsenicibacter rosenii]
MQRNQAVALTGRITIRVKSFFALPILKAQSGPCMAGYILSYLYALFLIPPGIIDDKRKQEN